MKKVVLKVNLHDDKEKQKTMKMVSSISGIDVISMDMKDEKLTVNGDADPVQVVSRLRKFWYTDILTVAPAKEPEKKEDDRDKKKKDDDEISEFVKLYKDYNRPYMITCYCVRSAEENPNACVIC